VRCFVALEIPADARERIAADIDRACGVFPDGLRLIPPQRWHITLAFFGQVPDDRVPELDLQLTRAVEGHGRLRLALSGAGRFGSGVLWIGVEGNAELLGSLACDVAQAGARVGAKAELRPLRPHVSVGRMRSDGNLRPLVAELSDARGPAWTADEVVLMSSVLGPSPTYSIEGRWALTSAGDARVGHVTQAENAG
jgi:RNA 2',3'-cyclic 3'-phosphodiesterase